MGIIRSGLVVTISTMLFLTIFLGNAFLTLSWSLEYDNVEPQVKNFALTTIESAGFKEQITSNRQLMNLYCKQNDSFNFSQGDISLDIPCSIIYQGTDTIIDYSVSTLIHDFYYKDYDCNFWECIKDSSNTYVLISEHAKEYWDMLYLYIILASIVLLFLLFVVIESKHSTLTIVGVLITVASFPFRKLNWLISFFPQGDLTDLFIALFAKSYNVFIIMTIIGIALFAIGIGFEFLGFGFWFTKLIGAFRKDKKEAKEKKEKQFSKEEVEEIIKETVEEVEEREHENK